MRINARLDPDHARKLEYLVRAYETTVTEIVKRSIDTLYERTAREGKSAHEIFQECGFIGSGKGDPDLSERYKEELTAILEAKHGDRG